MGYPLQYSWASLMAQLVKNPCAMWEIWFRSLGCKELDTTESLSLFKIIKVRQRTFVPLTTYSSL